MTVSGMNSSSASTLFSGLSTSNSGIYSALSDYNTIRSGSYGKLLSSYYRQNGGSSLSGASSSLKSNPAADHTSRGYELKYKQEQAAKANSSSSSTSYSKKTEAASAKVNSAVANSANQMVDALDSLRSNDTFKVTQGNYDTERIYLAAKNYVDAYNSVIDNAADSKVSGIVSNVSSIQSSTATYAKALSDIGITRTDDGKLNLSEEKLKSSDMSAVKSLFDKGSYGYSVRTSAYMTNYYAKQAQNNTNTYGASGSFSMNDLMSSYQSYI